MEGNHSLKPKAQKPNNDNENTKTFTSMVDLPTSIIIDILSRLPIKALSSCRCVCTHWRTITRDPFFTKMHLSRASSPGVIVQSKILEHGHRHDLHFAEPETCRHNDAVTSISTEFNRFNREFGIVGSVNGLLCLSEPLYDYDPVYICNPIIGEYMTIPKSDIDPCYEIVSGFGYVEETNQFKVIRMMYERLYDPMEGIYFKCEGEIYTIGSCEWRKLEVPYALRPGASEAYLNGGLHWLFNDICCGFDTPDFYTGIDTPIGIGIDTPEFIGCFMVDKEEFQLIPLPPGQFSEATRISETQLRLGVLGGNLCIFDDCSDEKMEIWMMKDYGVQESWTKQFVIQHPSIVEVKSEEGIYFKPLKLMDSGEILMIYDSVAMVCYDPKTELFRHLTLSGFPSGEYNGAVLHLGSLVSLKDVATHASENRNVAMDTSLKRDTENDESITRRNSDIPYGIWDSTLYPIPTHKTSDD